MRGWRDAFTWIFRTGKAEAELDEEIRSHLAIEECQRLEAGESAEQARSAARRGFGNELLVKETTRRVWLWRWLEDAWRDLGYGARVLRKNPGFACVAILTLALGIGCNTAIFSIINAVLLKPLPFYQPDRLIYLRETQPSAGYQEMTLNGQDYLDWKAANKTLEDATFYDSGQNYSISNAGSPETVRVGATEANFFQVLRVKPILGRAFARGEDTTGKNNVVVLGEAFWRQHYAGRTDAIGSTLLLDRRPFTVVGVVPAWLDLPHRAQLWIPLNMDEQRKDERANHSYRGIGRMKPGVTLAQTRADLEIISARLAAQYPQSNHGEGPLLTPLQERFTNDSRQQLLVLMAAVTLVLLIACSNVANLLLVRASGRQREMALRTALGASRIRLVRQLLTESVLLSLLGAGLGLLLAAGCISLIQAAAQLPIPRLTPIQVDWRVLAFAGIVSVAVGLMFGMAPAFHIRMEQTATGLRLALQNLSSSRTRTRVRDALVVAEITLSLALLMGAGLLLRSFALMRSADIGVQRQRVTTLALVLPTKAYETVASRENFYEQLLEKVSHEPGVESAALSLVLPLEGTRGRSVGPVGSTNLQDYHPVEWNVVTENYFNVLRIPLITGRIFTGLDLRIAAEQESRMMKLAEHDPKARSNAAIPMIVNRTLAQQLFPGQNAVGKKVSLWGETADIIGVVGDVKQIDIREPALPEAYGPFTTEMSNHFYPTRLLIRSSTAVPAVLGAARHDLAELDASLSFFDIRSMDDVVAENMLDTTVQTMLLGIFAALALLLAAIGLHGVMAYAVAQRTREIGIRLALGAQPRAVMGLILQRGARLALAGVVLGTPITFALTRLLSKLLFGIGANDLATFATVALLLAGVAMAACYFPARQAMRVDPNIALRCE
jgi:putative ABC transport system permease protein